MLLNKRQMSEGEGGKGNTCTYKHTWAIPFCIIIMVLLHDGQWCVLYCYLHAAAVHDLYEAQCLYYVMCVVITT